MLPAPALPEQADLVDEGGVSQVLDAITRAGMRAVVDAGSRIGVETLPALERATAIVIVCPTGAHGRRGVVRLAALLFRLGVADRPIGVVAARVWPLQRGAARALAELSGLPLWASVPQSLAVVRAARAASLRREAVRRLLTARRRGARAMTLWERAQALAPTTSEVTSLPDVAPDVLGPLLADPSVDEVLVNGPEQIWVERRGRLQRVSARFSDAEALRDACARLVASAGRRIDDASPMVDARLADGSRLNVVLPPVAPDGPLLSLRRFAPRAFTLEALVERGIARRTPPPTCSHAASRPASTS